MKIRKYGITLHRLVEQDIEMLRLKRNSTAVNKYMEFREHITPEMQEQWFNRINNFNNFFYIIEYEGNKLGLLNDKNIDWQARTSESGLFLWDENYINTFVPVLASLCLLETGFYYLNWNTSFIKVMFNNPQAQEYVSNLGYMMCEGQQGVDNQQYYLTKELFETKGRRFHKAAQAFIQEESGRGYVLLEPQDYESGLAQRIENELFIGMSDFNRVQTPEGCKYFR